MKKLPITKNHNGDERRVGFEIEYANLSIEDTSLIIKNLFGGEINQIHSAVCHVEGTEYGDFKIELDAIPLQKIAKNNVKLSKKLKDKKDIMDDVSLQLGQTVNEVSSKIVPLEIVSPPIAISKLEILNHLCDKLSEAGAKGTGRTFYYAFGVHINPEVVTIDVNYLRKILQSFLLLSPWLKKLHAIDITRKLTSFIDPFPKEYLELILDNNYQPNIEQFIKDYHTHNPTRNRSLDMLPVFAHINEEYVRKLFGSEEKINKRPTFHYRLPNCELHKDSWSPSKEWKRWMYVEELAGDEKKLSDLIEKWRLFNNKWFATKSSWIKEIESVMKKDE